MALNAHIRTERDQTMSTPCKTAAEAAAKRLTDGDLVDALELLRLRAWGLEAATAYLAGNHQDNNISGVGLLTLDFATELDRLAEAFRAEHDLRVAERKAAAL
jgi:hypothetical protein